MPVRLWTDTGWVDGNVVMSNGSGGTVAGEIRAWPWLPGVNLVNQLIYPAFAAVRLGHNEANDGTPFAANALYTSETLESLRPRILGHVNLRVLSTGELVSSFADTVAGTAVSATTATTWNTRTVASPVGGAAQPAGFWANATYPTKSIATEWAGKQILVAELSVGTARDPLKSWVAANQAQGSTIALSSVYADCTNMAAAGLYTVWQPSTFPGDSGNATYAAAAAAGIWGVYIAAGTVTKQMCDAAKAAGLKVWSGQFTTPAAASAAVALGVDVVLTPNPTTVAPATGPFPVNQTITHGYTWASGSTGQYEPDYMINTVGLRPPQVIRCYNEGNLGSNTPASRLALGYTVSLSWKPDPSTFGTTYNAAWRTTAETWIRANVPKSTKVFLTAHHEPEGPWPFPATDGSDWQRRWKIGQNQVTQMCRNLRLEGWDIWGMPILCDWLDYWNDGHSFSGWAPTDGSFDVDIMGWDAYPMGNTASGRARIGRLKMTADFVRAPYAYPYNPATFKGADGRNDIYATTRKLAKHSLDLSAALGREVPWANLEVGLIRGDVTGTPPAARPIEGDPTDGTSDTRYWYRLEQRAQWFRDYGNDLYTLPAQGLPAPLFVTWYFNGGCMVFANEGTAVAAINQTLDRSVPINWPRA